MRIMSFGAGVIVGIVLLGVTVFAYFRLGLAPVATSEKPMLFEHSLAKAALHARIRRDMPTSVPIPSDEVNIRAGAAIYQKNCAVCHGVPDQHATPVADGMFPNPPQLFVKMVTHDPDGEIYWKTKNGIRLTGMPAFGKTLSETELWDVSLLLKHADALPASAKTVLGSSGNCDTVAAPERKVAAAR